ncbi:MAG: methylated-DNA--[protein]-cysteine S-methyltransferase [Ignavibacteriae bacterium]|nr:methylated-DNA--[protein]-cysteine S-methyltransferase [Ignavibacteriota bacterium]MCB9214668.1 methylated-DNA--[protein]-cysteine S-methyltransferase [Ignavibacteria bacterium]
MKLTTNYIESPFGLMQVCATEEALTLLEFADRSDVEKQVASLQSFVESKVEEGTNSIIEQTTLELTEYFAGQRQQFSLPLFTPGTPFQQSVWHALIEIPFGETRSYGWLAHKLGDPKSVRAVAHANGQNRIAIIIPCHRVIGADGSLTGYAGGLERKKKLLQLEGATAPAPEGQGRLF